MFYTWRMADIKRTVQIKKLHEQGMESDLGNMTAADRLSLVWPLTLSAWAFKDETVAESRFQRHSVRVLRSGR